MAGTPDKRAGRRFGRRPALLVALGLVSSLGAAAALAAAVVTGSNPRGPSRPLSIRVEPATRTVTPGATATYTVRVARFDHRPIGLSGRTEVAVRGAGLPTGTKVSITSPRLHGGRPAPRVRTTLTITTATDTPPGSYEVRVGAHRPHRSGSAAVELTVSGPPAPGPPTSAPPPAEPPAVSIPTVELPGPPLTTPDAFTIAGSVPNPLTPGTGEPLDLTLTNLESTDLQITSLSVEVATISGPRIDASHACDGEDFSVEQFSGAPAFILPASSSADLGELGFDPGEWPTVSMLNRPVNQDGCKGASLSLSFSGAATEATS